MADRSDQIGLHNLKPKPTATVGANGAADPVPVVAESSPGKPEKPEGEAPKEGSNGG